MACETHTCKCGGVFFGNDLRCPDCGADDSYVTSYDEAPQDYPDTEEAEEEIQWAS